MSLDWQVQNKIENTLDNDEFFVDWLETHEDGKRHFADFYEGVLAGYGVLADYSAYSMDGEMLSAFQTWDRVENDGQAEIQYVQYVVEWAHEMGNYKYDE